MKLDNTYTSLIPPHIIYTTENLPYWVLREFLFLCIKLREAYARIDELESYLEDGDKNDSSK